MSIVVFNDSDAREKSSLATGAPPSQHQPQAPAEVNVKKAHTDTGVCVCVRVCLSRLVDINVVKLHIASAYYSRESNFN